MSADEHDHRQRLAYLRYAAAEYADMWRSEPTTEKARENWRRYRFARERYLAARNEGRRRFGVSRPYRQEGER